MAYILLAASGAAFGGSQRVIGEVISVDPAGRIELKADDGARAQACVNGGTRVLRVPPGEKDLSKAAPVPLADIAAGDRVLAIGPCPAARIIVMAKSDLVQKQERERVEWRERGVGGVVVELNPATREITLKSAVRLVLIEHNVGTVYRRYPADSIRFADARPASFDEMRIGDQVRVLGKSLDDGARIMPEAIVSGSFRTLAGLIASVDAARAEIHVKDLDTKKLVTVRLTSDTKTRRIPDAAATMLSNRLRALDGPRRGVDFSEMLERFPTFTLTELKIGEAIVLTGTKSDDPSRTTAAVVVAGVEPLLRAASPSGESLGGAWNLEIGLP